MQEVLISGLGEVKVRLKNISVMALITLTLRPLKAAAFSENLMIIFLTNILAVPAVISHLDKWVPECINSFLTNGIFEKSIKLLSDTTSMRSTLDSLEGNNALYLLGNLLELAQIVKEIDLPNFVVSKLFSYFKWPMVHTSIKRELNIFSVCCYWIAGRLSKSGFK